MRFFVKSVGHWVKYGLNQGNPLQYFKIIFILLSYFGSLSNYFRVQRVDIWLYWGFYGVRGEVVCEKALAIEATTTWNRLIQYKYLETTHSFTTVLKHIVINKLFSSWLLMMAENPNTSIDIDTERQDDKSALGSLRSNVFTTQKKPASLTIIQHNYFTEATQSKSAKKNH